VRITFVVGFRGPAGRQQAGQGVRAGWSSAGQAPARLASRDDWD
jgi:hypothetical protein